MTSKNVAAVDWVVIACYFCFCIGLGIWSKFRKQGKKEETAESYFLAGRSMLWWAVGGSLFASNIGSEHFIGLAGSGAATGIGVVAYEWQASWILLLLGFFFVPIYLRSKIFTMPEYLKKRFQSKYMRAYMTVVSLLSYVTTKISVDMYAGGVFLREAMGWNIYVSSALILAITALYTLLGGLTAVIYTDVLQCTIMIIGAIALSVVGFNKLGGLDALWEQYPNAIGQAFAKATAATATKTNITTAATTAITMTTMFSTMATNLTTMATNSTRVDTCYKIDPNWNHMFRPYDDPEYPWIGLWFSLPVTGIWYWCTDQVIVQRTLGAKNIGHARAGTIFAGFLKILPMYIMVMPGMISRVLYKDTIGCSDPATCFAYCGNKFGCSNNAYPRKRMQSMAYTAPKVRWETLPPLPTFRAYSAVCSHDGNIYVFGGCNKMGQPLDVAESYDPKTKVWTTLPSLAVKRAQPNAIIYQEKIVVIGGCKEMNQPVKEVEMFDPETKTWSQLPALSTSLVFYAVVVHHNNIYINGGMSTTGQCNDVALVLKDGGNAWEICSRMPSRRYACKAFAHDDEIYVVGGRVMMNPSNAVESLDVATKCWSKHPEILVSRMFSALVQKDNLIYLLGGLKGTGEYVNAAEVFDMEKNSWKNINAMPSRRADMATGMFKKWIVVAGGQCDYGQAKTTEIYDMESGRWHVLPEMPTPRCAGCPVVCDNMFIVIGGMSPGGPCGNVEALIFE